MILEQSRLMIGIHKILPDGKEFILSSPHSELRVKINSAQKEYLMLLEKGHTIENIILYYIKNHRPISFTDLYYLVEGLLKLNLVANHEIKRYYEQLDDLKTDLAHAPGQDGKTIKKWTTRDIVDFPFFRQLKPNVIDLFVDNAEIITVPIRTKIIASGQTDRHMYVILEGEATIYRTDQRGRHEPITIIPAGSVFGEGGFMLNKPRSADVITNVDTTLARISWNEKDFGPLMKTYPPDALQQRFWILHGLLSSPLFHNVPSETMDRFFYIGKAVGAQAGTVVCKEGEPGDSFFIVIQGSVEVSQKRKHISTLKQGEIFGEIALMLNDGLRTATVVVPDFALLLEVHKDEFLKVLSQNLVLASEIESVALKRQQKLKS
ncbi:MAG: hypothetical protein BroJett040_17170 [Oligoflexia bacterium]|nr:MAG: hypothetical protein BroJett040_17170 [Oligoflexia bacterium]